jgi:hypothetical protein
LADRAELELVISSQVDRVLAGLTTFERTLNTIEKAHVTAGAAAATHGQHVENLTGKISNLANIANLFVAWQAIERALGMFSGLEKFNTDLLHTTDLLGGNAQAASTWSAIANVMGISVEVIDKAFGKLSMNLNSGTSPALKQMGIASEDANGKLRPINDVLNQAADYFRAHAGASNNAALANELFGKSGYQLLPILTQGSAGLAAFTAEARKYGLILDSETIQRNAAFTFQLKEAEMAGRGLAISFGNALLPGLAALGQSFSRLVADNLPTFVSAVNRAVSYVIGMVEGLTGMSMAVSEGAMALADMSGAVIDTGSAMDKATSSAKALADAEQRVRDRAKDATQAIDDQIRALQTSQQLQQFEDQQVKLKQRSADEKTAIAKITADRELALFLQNNVQAVQLEIQLTAAKQAQANTQIEITRGQQGEETRGRVAALETQKRGIADVAQEQIAAMQRAARGSVDAMSGASSSITDVMARGGVDAGAKFKFAMDSAAEKTGISMGEKLMDALFGPLVKSPDASASMGYNLIRSGGGNFLKIGQAMGEAIATGITTTLGDRITQWLKDYGKDLTQGGGGFKAAAAQQHGSIALGDGSIVSYERGGMVPGPIGVARLSVVHGGEEVRTPDQQRASSPAGDAETRLILRYIASLLEQINSSTPRGGLAAAQRMA